MAWIYLPASGALLSPLAIGLDPLPTARSTNTPNQSSFPECLKADSHTPPFSQTSESLTAQGFEDWLTLFTAVSPVRTSALQALERAWKVSEAAYFSRSCGWSKRSDQVLFSSKTFLQSELVAVNEYAKSWPRSGMIVGGRLYPLSTLERRTKESAGFSWPTPKAMEIDETPESYLARMARSKDPKTNTKKKISNLGVAVKLTTAVGGKLNPRWVEWLMNYPTDWTELNALVTQWSRSKSGKPFVS